MRITSLSEDFCHNLQTEDVSEGVRIYLAKNTIYLTEDAMALIEGDLCMSSSKLIKRYKNQNLEILN